MTKHDRDYFVKFVERGRVFLQFVFPYRLTILCYERTKH